MSPQINAEQVPTTGCPVCPNIRHDTGSRQSRNNSRAAVLRGHGGGAGRRGARGRAFTSVGLKLSVTNPLDTAIWNTLVHECINREVPETRVLRQDSPSYV